MARFIHTVLFSCRQKRCISGQFGDRAHVMSRSVEWAQAYSPVENSLFHMFGNINITL